MSDLCASLFSRGEVWFRCVIVIGLVSSDWCSFKMAPPPEYDKEPKAPDKNVTSSSTDDSKLTHSPHDQQTNSDNKPNAAANIETEVSWPLCCHFFVNFLILKWIYFAVFVAVCIFFGISIFWRILAKCMCILKTSGFPRNLRICKNGDAGFFCEYCSECDERT